MAISWPEHQFGAASAYRLRDFQRVQLTVAPQTCLVAEMGRQRVAGLTRRQDGMERSRPGEIGDQGSRPFDLAEKRWVMR